MRMPVKYALNQRCNCHISSQAVIDIYARTAVYTVSGSSSSRQDGKSAVSSGHSPGSSARVYVRGSARGYGSKHEEYK